MDATAEIGRNPVSKHHRFSLSVENEHAERGQGNNNNINLELYYSAVVYVITINMYRKL